MALAAAAFFKKGKSIHGVRIASSEGSLVCSPIQNHSSLFTDYATCM